jgi:YOP proteins translocation protein K (YscK)
MFAASVDQRVFDFNCRPLDYIDPSWLDAHERPVVQRLAASDDAQARSLASGWLLDRFDLAHSHDFDFTYPAKRLLLLDAAALRDISLLLGLAALSHWLRTWVTRAEQQRLQGALGEPLFEFYMSHVLRWPPVARLVLSGERRRALLEGGTGTAPLQASARLGATLLLLSCDAPGNPSLRRGQLKFSRELGRVERTRPLPEARQQAVVEFCVACVIRERHPSWHWLF